MNSPGCSTLGVVVEIVLHVSWLTLHVQVCVNERKIMREINGKVKEKYNKGNKKDNKVNKKDYKVNKKYNKMNKKVNKVNKKKTNVSNTEIKKEKNEYGRK